MRRHRDGQARRGSVLQALALATAALGLAAGPAAADGAYLRAYLLLGADGARIARAVTEAPACPSMLVDGQPQPMAVRAPIETVAQRPTISDPAETKPSVFAVTTCEAVVAAGAQGVQVGGQALPLPPAVINRIVVIGDTGCRIKGSESAYQACNDPRAYPFAQVAASAAAWKPDLVVHVGDYLYRETACPADQPGCAGSPWGYGSDAWRADFLDPAAPLMAAAPLALARGNHESCDRAGQGWWRFLDVHPLAPGQGCDRAEADDVGDFASPYVVPIGGGVQLILFDSSHTTGAAIAPGDVRAARYRDAYAQIAALAARAPHNILVDHHPILGFSARVLKNGDVELQPGNGGLRSVFAPINPGLIPANIDILLSGHIHLWEAVSFSSPHPVQFIAGFSGTQEDTVPLPAAAPPGASPAPGAVVQSLSSWIEGFGFMTLERAGADRWHVEVHDAAGAVVDTCEVVGSKAQCAQAQVLGH
jgi:hypothetical protein